MSKILIVDDSPDTLNVLQWSLQKKGYDCTTACYRNGLFNQLNHFIPSLIVMDIELNGDDGRDICREIKNDPALKNIPVIICSGKHELLDNFQTYLADDFLPKPFDVNSLIRKIDRLLNRAEIVSQH